MTLTPRQQAAVLAGITFAVFSSTLSSGFVYDARMQILTGDFIHDRRNWPAVLTGGVLGMDVLDFNRPAMLASLMLDAAIFGRDPFGYHLTSVLLHVANVLLLWLVIRDVLDTSSRPETAMPAALATLVFAVHPIVTEAVCEPSYREDLLVCFFSLAALVATSRMKPEAGSGSRSGNNAIGKAPHENPPVTAGGFPTLAAGLAATSCLLAVASKEAGIVAPLLLAAFWWLFRRGEPGRFWGTVVAASAAVVIAFLSARFLLEPSVSSIFATKPGHLGGSLTQAMLIEPRILALYAQLILFPTNLCADYGIMSVNHLPLPIALGLLAAIAVGAGLASSHDRRLLFAFAMIVLPLLPVSNLIPIYRPAADRYLYLPMAGIAVAVACLLDAPWLRGRDSFRRRALVGCTATITLLGLACVQRQHVWADSLALWEDSYRKNPGSFTNAMGLGEALREAGRFPEAEQLTRTAIRLSNEQRGDVWATLALILDAGGSKAEAGAALEKALKLEPRLSDPESLVKVLAMERPTAKELRNLLDKHQAGWPERPKTGY